MGTPKRKRVFDTDRRIRMGIWGLGRGMSFYRTCEFLNIDVVAGCDYNLHMRERFSQTCPTAFVTDDEDKFLAHDLDAVLLATYCPAHGKHAIKCLNAGKHVVSEVTAFHTMAEGVRLVETAEKSGLVYNLAENYPFSAANMWLARKWREGLFGDLMYAEFEYVHECRTLCYTYIDGIPVKPGNCVHNWRSWINYHYYCTHSLGPIMCITGTRPTRVVTLPGRQKLAGYLVPELEGMGGIAPSLINMNNGAVVRNLDGRHDERLARAAPVGHAGGCRDQHRQAPPAPPGRQRRIAQARGQAKLGRPGRARRADWARRRRLLGALQLRATDTHGRAGAL